MLIEARLEVLFLGMICDAARLAARGVCRDVNACWAALAGFSLGCAEGNPSWRRHTGDPLLAPAPAQHNGQPEPPLMYHKLLSQHCNGTFIFKSYSSFLSGANPRLPFPISSLSPPLSLSLSLTLFPPEWPLGLDSICIQSFITLFTAALQFFYFSF